ncbi:hypothetical protein GCM10023085_40000 [Actinomadura viridis]|uniref:Uncharacterized protein n=1 Tax=Actinomadura viridis TaxID=58110 RepID=A0A931GM26_9ACTN|nr:hypothetical protein [Actinomadura viridis]MBG6092718.1 hypothetical protein [Actinomadura viridis]
MGGRVRAAYARIMLVYQAAVLWRPVPKRIYRDRALAGPVR